MIIFQTFCCRILQIYISSVNQHKKLADNRFLSILKTFSLGEMLRIGVRMGDLRLKYENCKQIKLLKYMYCERRLLFTF